MRVVSLMENTGKRDDLHTEHGLSLYIETEHHRILFDTGASERFLDNADRLGVDLAAVDTLVISHGHYDHTGGIPGFLRRNQQAKVYIRENAFAPFYHCSETETRFIGIDSIRREHPRLTLTGGNVTIDPELTLFTQVRGRRCYPETNRKLKYFDGQTYRQDDFRHEQNLAITERGKRVVISGCSHNGIVNILDSYHALFHQMPDVAIGGFHTAGKDEFDPNSVAQLRKMAQALQETGTVCYTCHCTGQEPYAILKEQMGDQIHYLATGEEICL